MSAELQAGRLRVGQAIRRERQALELSLTDLAARVGVAVSTVSKIETGKISVSFERLDAIGRALRVDLGKLIGEPSGTREAGSETVSAPRTGMRRSVTRGAEGVVVDAGPYRHVFHAADLLRKQFQTLVSDVLVTDIRDYGPLTHHPGEELNFVLRGELEFHSEVYAPVRLKAGDSIHFDAEMGHAHIRVGSEPCQLLSVVSPRAATAEASKTGEVYRIHQSPAAQTLPATKRVVRRKA